MTHSIDTGSGVILHRGVSDGSDGAIPPGRKCFLPMHYIYIGIESQQLDGGAQGLGDGKGIYLEDSEVDRYTEKNNIL